MKNKNLRVQSTNQITYNHHRNLFRNTGSALHLSADPYKEDRGVLLGFPPSWAPAASPPAGRVGVPSSSPCTHSYQQNTMCYCNQSQI